MKCNYIAMLSFVNVLILLLELEIKKVLPLKSMYFYCLLSTDYNRRKMVETKARILYTTTPIRTQAYFGTLCIRR